MQCVSSVEDNNYHLLEIHERTVKLHTKNMRKWEIKTALGGFPGHLVVKNLPVNAEDMGPVPGLGRSHMSWSN